MFRCFNGFSVFLLLLLLLLSFFFRFFFFLPFSVQGYIYIGLPLSFGNVSVPGVRLKRRFTRMGLARAHVQPTKLREQRVGRGRGDTGGAGRGEDVLRHFRPRLNKKLRRFYRTRWLADPERYTKGYTPIRGGGGGFPFNWKPAFVSMAPRLHQVHTIPRFSSREGRRSNDLIVAFLSGR